MARLESFKLRSGQRDKGFAGWLELCDRTKLWNAFLSQKQCFGHTLSQKFLDHIVLFCIHRHGEIGRQCPTSCGPNGHAGALPPAPPPPRTTPPPLPLNPPPRPP